MNVRKRGPGALAALSVMAVLALAGCAEADGGSASGGGEGVEQGADKATYQAAFEDVDPIELKTQVSGPEGALTNQNLVDYFDAVEDWSGGKITFDITYASAIVPPTEEHEALSDGRLDVARYIPSYAPDVFPAHALLEETSIIGSKSPVVGHMETFSWMNELGLATPEIAEEAEGEGIHLLMPAYSFATTAVECGEKAVSLDEFDGKVTAASSPLTVAESEALGMEPASVAFPEFYESLQRGAIDCATTGVSAAVNVGIMEVAPHAALDSQVAMPMTPASFGVSLDVWEDLPLVAQQLLHDRLDTIATSFMDMDLESYKTYVSELQANGGDAYPFADDSRKAIESANDEFLDEVAAGNVLDDQSGFVEQARTSAEEWNGVLTGELGYADEVDYAGIPGWYKDGVVDFQPWADRLMQDVFSESRPS